MKHILVIQKLVLPQPPEITGYLLRIATDTEVAAPGKLICCTRCCGSHHYAPFVSTQEIQRRLSAFEAAHRDC